MGNRNVTRETTLRQVETLELLTLIGPLIREDRDLVYVEDERAIYSLDEDSAATADGLDTVAPADGTGRWFRQSAKVSGFLESVEAANVLNPSGLTPTKGERWLINGTGAGAWSGEDNNVAEYVEGSVTDASSWRFTAPAAGNIVPSKGAGELYIYEGSAWESVGFQSDVTEILAENTDGSLFIPASDFVGISGTWTPGIGANGPTLVRTAGTGTEKAVASIPLPQRTSASRGRKPTAFRLVYSVDTADLDDVTLDVYSLTDGGDGLLPTRAAFGGLTGNDTDADEDHDTAAERGDDTGAPENHTMTVTPPAPAYPSAAEGLYAEVTVDGDAGGAGEFTLRGLWIDYDETLVDGAA